MDISYVWTKEGWLYLAVILDLHSRRVIGWAVSNRMKRDLAIRALNMAIALRQPPKDCIYYPAGDYEVICREGITHPLVTFLFGMNCRAKDRGNQYCLHDYRQILRRHVFKVSMSGKGNCYGNAALETYFKTTKAELIWGHPWETRR